VPAQKWCRGCRPLFSSRQTIARDTLTLVNGPASRTFPSVCSDRSKTELSGPTPGLKGGIEAAVAVQPRNAIAYHSVDRREKRHRSVTFRPLAAPGQRRRRRAFSIVGLKGQVHIARRRNG